jgi:hypothetical protein
VVQRQALYLGEVNASQRSASGDRSEVMENPAAVI